MSTYNETYVPITWTKTSKEVAKNVMRSSWENEENINENIFNLSIVKYSEMQDSLSNGSERLLLFFTSGNNEICLEEEVSNSPRKIGDKEKTISDKSYMLKVYDRETKAIMYYNTVLARVELEKKEDGVSDGSLIEDLEVIAVYDEDEENPFDTEFNEPED